MSIAVIYITDYGHPSQTVIQSSIRMKENILRTNQGSLGVGRNTFLSSPHLCFITVFICDLFVSRDDPLMS